MTSVFCHPLDKELDASQAERRVRLFGPASMGICGIGTRMEWAFKRLDLGVSQRAYDFLSIAMAVMAADEFVSRRDTATDGFARDLSLKIAVADPVSWSQQADNLAKTLGFLTGDNWQIEFIGGGKTAPSQQQKRRMRTRIYASRCNLVCLFSGGLDSLIGAVDVIQNPNIKPLLVSRSATGDNSYQKRLLEKLPTTDAFRINDAPRKAKLVPWQKEGTTRSRSLLFIALAACCADAISEFRSISSTKLLIPENGVIAINPPLTHRRIGAASTRTAHPHYLEGIRRCFNVMGIKADIENPFALMTKGEMILNSQHRALLDPLVSKTVSCGKYKRKGQQCGRCLPCLIRRSANHAAGISEPQGTYDADDLRLVTGNRGTSQDVYAVRRALRTHTPDRIALWVQKAGPLENQNPDLTYAVVSRGLKEIEAFLGSKGVYP